MSQQPIMMTSSVTSVYINYALQNSEWDTLSTSSDLPSSVLSDIEELLPSTNFSSRSEEIRRDSDTEIVSKTAPPVVEIAGLQQSNASKSPINLKRKRSAPVVEDREG